MRHLKVIISCVLVLTACGLYAQQTLHIGMTADEFKAILPGVLPDTFQYNTDLYMQETLDSIYGKWSFNFYRNALSSADFTGESKINNEYDFNKWIINAKRIIDDYTKVYGKPLKYRQGTNKYADRNNYEHQHATGKREVFHEAIWETKAMRITISCDYRSNYYEEFKEGLPNGPAEWFYYDFRIKYEYLAAAGNVPSYEPGRFYVGMDVKDFAKVFPALFPNGIGITGQWNKEEKLNGLTGGWAYEFKDGRLSWMHYDKYFDEINDTNFRKCLSATEQLIKDYTLQYGKPDTTITGNTRFIDPYKKHHWGYDVIEARWKDYKGMKIKVEFTFLGGKGEYHFLVVVNYFDKNYPYYD